MEALDPWTGLSELAELPGLGKSYPPVYADGSAKSVDDVSAADEVSKTGEDETSVGATEEPTE